MQFSPARAWKKIKHGQTAASPGSEAASAQVSEGTGAAGELEPAGTAALSDMRGHDSRETSAPAPGAAGGSVPAPVSMGENQPGKAGGLSNSQRLQQALYKDDTRGEKTIAVGQTALCLFILLLHVIGQISLGSFSFNPWMLGPLGVVVVSSAVRFMLARRDRLLTPLLITLSVLDVCMFMVLIWGYQIVYEHPAGGALKAPSFVLLLAVVVLRALRFHPRPIMITGTVAALGWIVMVGLAVNHDGPEAITRNYVEFLTSTRIMIGAEIEKLVGIAALTITLAWGTYKARQILSQSAHAQDYADALRAAQTSLQLANDAKQQAENALAKLEERDAQLLDQNTRFNAALENMSQGITMFDGDQRLLVFNDRYLEIYGLPPGSVKYGMTFREIADLRIRYSYDKSENRELIRERLHAAADSGQKITMIDELAGGRIVALSRQPMRGGAWVTTHEDITELQRIQDQMAHMAHHDALTDLPNRTLLHERIGEALKRSVRGERFAVLCLDIDRFKGINDTLGHPVGDELLKAIAERLLSCVRETDTVARLGGDEFAIIQTAAEQPTKATMLASRLCAEIRKPFEIDGHQVVVETSIGIAIAPEDGADADQLMKNADIALYGAKNDGRGVYRFFEAEMDALMKERRELELDLRLGMERNEFEVHYQPLYNLKSNTISGFEALLRWRHPTRGVISPDDFVPIAEDIGLIVPLGEWVIQTACRDAAAWQGDTKVAVNLSPVQFRNGNLVSVVTQALAASGMAATRLELEITESILLQDSEANFKMLHELRALGVRIAMDDFGTGYSSLSYLRSFPFDKIKIDRCFVQDLDQSDDAKAIIRAVASLASSLGMDTTAEGVETEQQLKSIFSEGYTEIQGFLFSRPVTADKAALLTGDTSYAARRKTADAAAKSRQARPARAS